MSFCLSAGLLSGVLYEISRIFCLYCCQQNLLKKCVHIHDWRKILAHISNKYFKTAALWKLYVFQWFDHSDLTPPPPHFLNLFYWSWSNLRDKYSRYRGYDPQKNTFRSTTKKINLAASLKRFIYVLTGIMNSLKYNFIKSFF